MAKTKVSNECRQTDSPYLPETVTVERVESISACEKLFRLKREARRARKAAPAHAPGQFYMVGLPGYGEAPISVCAPSATGSDIELCIRVAGNLTGALHRLGPGDTLSLRGPFGDGFDTTALKGRDIIFIAGGIGIAPMRSLLLAVLNGRKAYGELKLLYGAKSPEEVLFTGDFKVWKKKGLSVDVIVDSGTEGWNGRVGLVTDLMGPVKLNALQTTAVVIGPPIMYRFVVAKLKRMGMAESDILLSLERRMKCGVGKCGHCQINSSYVCQDGPVYTLESLEGMGEAFK
ncbi:MAG: FAD/NAD(P)-binding protein [Proteobacteria bacterium]|nr:FAD/NAD(P)-binding protein [Pseudomonadota bacterium]